MKFLATWVLLLTSATVSAEDARQGLKEQLEAVLALDQKHRAAGSTERWLDMAEKQAAIDRSNLAIVETLVKVHGWPRLSDVGEDAALAAFLVIQHADLATQERYLPVIRSRVAENEAKGAWLALLTDRILVGKGKPQLYGTQFRANPATGESEPLPIEDPAHVNARRTALGMKPLKLPTQ